MFQKNVDLISLCVINSDFHLLAVSSYIRNYKFVIYSNNAASNSLLVAI